MGNNKEFTQLCVWEGVTLGDSSPVEFIAWLEKEFGCRFRYVKEVKTLPDATGPSGRIDQFFYVHSEDQNKFAVPRLACGIRWWEDVLGNGGRHLYPPEFLEEHPKTW